MLDDSILRRFVFQSRSVNPIQFKNFWNCGEHRSWGKTFFFLFQFFWKSVRFFCIFAKYITRGHETMWHCIQWSNTHFIYCCRSAKDKDQRFVFWTRSERHLIVADWYDIENNVTSEMRVHRFKFKEVGIRNRRTHSHFITQMMIASPKSGEFRRLRSVRNFGQEGRILAMRKWWFFTTKHGNAFSENDREAVEPQDGYVWWFQLSTRRKMRGLTTCIDEVHKVVKKWCYEHCKKSCWKNDADPRDCTLNQARCIPSPCDDPSYFCRGLENHVLHLLYVFCVEPGRILKVPMFFRRWKEAASCFVWSFFRWLLQHDVFFDWYISLVIHLVKRVFVGIWKLCSKGEEMITVSRTTTRRSIGKKRTRHFHSKCTLSCQQHNWLICNTTTARPNFWAKSCYRPLIIYHTPDHLIAGCKIQNRATAEMSSSPRNLSQRFLQKRFLSTGTLCIISYKQRKFSSQQWVCNISACHFF